MTTLDKTLAAAENTLQRVISAEEAHSAEIAALERRIEGLRSDTVETLTAAILAGKKPAAARSEKRAELVAKLEELRGASPAFDAAISQARIAVEDARAALAAAQHDLDVEALQPEIESWYEAADALSRVHEKIDERLRKIGHGVVLSKAFFPLKNAGVASERKSQAHSAWMQMYNAAAFVATLRKTGALTEYNRKAEK